MAEELELGIHIYNADQKKWLHFDERQWTNCIYSAATFEGEEGRGRYVAQSVMERVQGADTCYLMMSLH